MKRAVISTYSHWYSYGSVLQSMALQKALNGIYIDSRTIVYTVDKNAPAIKKPENNSLVDYFKYFYQLHHRQK